MNKNFEELSKCWNDYGVDKPYWSVLTNPIFINPDEANLKIFYDSGINSAISINEFLKKHELPLIEGKIVLDFGTGTGRIAHGLIHFGAKEVIGLDISEKHLELAKQNVISEKATWVHLKEMKPISEYVNKKVELIVSYIVLQHNRPDVLKQYVGWLLETLDVHGVALLHIPYYKENYNPNIDFGEMREMEMHCVPKDEIEAIVEMNNCRLIEAEEIDMCGGGIKNCVYVIQKL